MHTSKAQKETERSSEETKTKGESAKTVACPPAFPPAHPPVAHSGSPVGVFRQPEYRDIAGVVEANEPSIYVHGENDGQRHHTSKHDVGRKRIKRQRLLPTFDEPRRKALGPPVVLARPGILPGGPVHGKRFLPPAVRVYAGPRRLKALSGCR